MARAKAEAAGFQLPDSAKVFLTLLIQAAAQAALDWLNRRSSQLMDAAKESVRAEVTEQVRAEVAAQKPAAEAPQS